jgi:hypothetical protein
MQTIPDAPRGKFRTPYMNSKFIMPGLIILTCVLSYTYNKENVIRFFQNEPVLVDAGTLIGDSERGELEIIKKNVSEKDPGGLEKANYDIEAYLSGLPEENYSSFVQSLPIPENKKFEKGWDVFKHKIPLWIFMITCLVLSYYAFTKNLSLIPLLGLLCCLYMMSELGISNWIGFGIWLIVGLVIYFAYSMKRSKLNAST